MYDWNDIRIFLAIARTGSALAAARELRLNQTTVTRRIDALEHSLGATLFTRGARGSDLTELGQALLPHAQAMEHAALALDGEAGRLHRDQGGEIRVTAPEAIMAIFVGKLTSRFRDRHSNVRFDYVSAEHRLDLAMGEADVAFRAGGVLEGDTLVCQALPDIAWAVYASTAYANRQRLPLQVSDLGGHAYIAYAGPITQMPHLQSFKSLVRDCEVVGTSNNVPNMAGMIRAGLGLGLLPCLVGDVQADLIRCFVPSDVLLTPWWIVASREANNLQRVRDFMAFSADHLRPLRAALSGKLDQSAGRALFENL